MSKHHAAISSSVSVLVSFIKERTSLKLLESSQSGILQELERSDIEKIINIVNTSISESFTLGYTDVEAAVSKILEEK